MKKLIASILTASVLSAMIITGCGASATQVIMEKAEEKASTQQVAQETKKASDDGVETEDEALVDDETELAETEDTQRTGGITDVATDKTGIDLQDMIIKQEVILIDESDAYSEYLIIFYGADTHKLMAISDEIHFDPSAGYTESYLRDEFDINSVYKNFTTFDFTSIEIFDEGDELVYIAWFKDLDKKENFTTMHEEGYLVLQEDPAIVTYVDAQSYIDSLTASGDVTVIDSTEAADRHLHLKLDK